MLFRSSSGEKCQRAYHEAITEEGDDEEGCVEHNVHREVLCGEEERPWPAWVVLRANGVRGTVPFHPKTCTYSIVNIAYLNSARLNRYEHDLHQEDHRDVCQHEHRLLARVSRLPKIVDTVREHAYLDSCDACERHVSRIRSMVRTESQPTDDIAGHERPFKEYRVCRLILRSP